MTGTIGQRVFSAIAHHAQLRLGQEYQIVAVTDINPVMTEMVVSHKGSGELQGARVYHVAPDQHATVRDYWSSEAYMLDGLQHDLLHRPMGLRPLGQELAFVYSHVPGVSLDRLLAQVGHLPVNFATRIAVELLQALESVYARGSAHFMLKPADVVLKYDGSISLRNFGLYDFELQVGKLLGVSHLLNAQYVAPEILLAEELTVSADLYSVGVLLFEALTGQSPFSGDYEAVKQSHIDQNPPNPQAINADVNLGVSRILMRALAKRPNQRFVHLSEFKQALAFMLPAGERDDILATPGTEETIWNEADRAKIDHDLNQANQLANAGDLEGAVRSIDSVLMAYPRHEGAKMLRNQFQTQLVGPRIRDYMAAAREKLDAQDFSGALAIAVRALDDAPDTSEAWNTVKFIFEQFLESAHSPSINYDSAALITAAQLAKSKSATLLAQRLYALALIQDPQQPEAQQEWAPMLKAPAAAPMNRPASQAPPPGPSAPPSIDGSFDQARADSPTVMMPAMTPGSSAPPAPPSKDDINEMETVMRPVSELMESLSEEVVDHSMVQRGVDEAVLQIQIMMSEGRLNEALEQGKAYLQQYPDDPALKTLLERAASQAREQAIERGMLKINQLLSKKDFSGVHKVASGILKIRPDHEGARQALTQAESQVATGRELVKFLRQINQLEMQGQLDQAHSLLEHAERQFSDVPELVSLRQRIKQKMDIRNEAEWRFSEAQSMVQRGNIEGAVAKLNELIDRHPNFNRAHQLLETLGAGRTMGLAKDKTLFRNDAATELLPTVKPSDQPQEVEQQWQPEASLRPQNVPVAAASVQKKSRSGLWLGLGAIVLIAVVGVGGYLYKQNRDRQRYLASKYLAAAELESAGKWPEAVQSWQALIAESGEFKDSKARLNSLQDRIRQRQQSIADNFETAQQYFDDGLLYDSSNENAVAYLKRNLEIEPNHDPSKDLLAQIRDDRMAEARLLFEDDKVTDAREMYLVVREIDPEFEDQEFNRQVQDWVFANMVEPELAKMERAIKRKKWDEAFEISDQLKAVVDDPTPINSRWNEEMAEFERLVEEAEAKNQAEKILGYLQIMCRIRPDDIDLQDRKNLLSRELNNAKIRATEDKLQKAMNSGNFARVGLLANELAALDSEHPLAKDALQNAVARLEDLAQREKTGDPRRAVKTYDSLIRISNTSTYRNERARINRSVQEFDGQFVQLKSGLNGSYDEVNRRINTFLEKYRDFKSDKNYAEAVDLQAQVAKEKENLDKVLQWESRAANDKTLTYSEVLDNLKKNSGFSLAFAKQPVARLIAKYEEMIVNYRGAVTLVIKGARNLPDANDIGNKAPEAFCELEIGGLKFKTEVIKDNRNPVWNQTCAFQADGSPLVFRVYDDNKFGKAQLLGALQIPQIPKSGKDLAYKSPDGWSIVIDIKRDR